MASTEDISLETQSPTPHPEAILARAKELIEEKGWCQRQGKNARDEICLAYAISAACGYANVSNKIGLTKYEAAMEFLALKLGIDPWYEIVKWNDHPERTKEEVLEALSV